MSKLIEKLNSEVVDFWEEHEFHDTYEPKCSECYKFALSIPVGERAFLLNDMNIIDDTLRPPLTREDEEQLTFDKRMEEAEGRERDEANGEL